MDVRRRVAFTTAAGALTLTATLTAFTPGAGAHPRYPDRHEPRSTTFAVIGDIPYGDAQIAAFPQHIAQLNADRGLRFVQHLGDIKSGSTLCSNDYFSWVKSEFDQFRHPLIYAVGDNEWTDCHRPNNGSYNPLERLDTLRRTFFAHPDRSLGSPAMKLASQDAEGYPEEARYELADVAFASLHVIGSNNSLDPWTGQPAPTPEQTAEVLGRTADTIQVITETFDTARKHNGRAVALMMQADMFDPTVTDPAYADYFGFTPIVRTIAREAQKFGKPVYLFNGDSHVYNVDRPLAAGSQWRAFYGVDGPAPNLERITVDGSTDVNDYLRVTISPRGTAAPGKDVLTWTRVPFTS